MKINLRLYGILRDQIPPEHLGRVELDIPEGTTISGLLQSLNIRGRFHVSVNDEIEDDWETALHDGDQLSCFPPSGGGKE